MSKKHPKLAPTRWHFTSRFFFKNYETIKTISHCLFWTCLMKKTGAMLQFCRLKYICSSWNSFISSCLKFFTFFNIRMSSKFYSNWKIQMYWVQIYWISFHWLFFRQYSRITFKTRGSNCAPPGWHSARPAVRIPANESDIFEMESRVRLVRISLRTVCPVVNDHKIKVNTKLQAYILITHWNRM